MRRGFGRRSVAAGAVLAAMLAWSAVAEAMTVGQRVVASAVVRVRAEPTLNGTLLARRLTGSLGTITDGPVLADGITWWWVDYEGNPDGWTGEDYLRSVYYPPPESAGGWRSLVALNAAPTSTQLANQKTLAGVDWSKLKLAWDYSQSFGKPSDVLVIRNGYVVGEWGSRTARGLASISKSLTGVAATKLFDLSSQGGTLLPISSSDPIARFLPDGWAGGDANKLTISVWDLLAMRSGLQPHDEPFTDNYLSLVLNRPSVAPPLQQWAYASLPVDLLSIVMQRASGQTVRQLFNQRIGAPIGMAALSWSTFGDYSRASSGASASARDLARVGYLLLNKGIWGTGNATQQILSSRPADRLATASTCSLPLSFVATPGSPFPVDPESRHFYGGLWWSNRTGQALGSAVPRDAFYAHGYMEKLLVVVPSYNLIVVRNGTAPAALPEFRREFMRRIMAAMTAEPVIFDQPAVRSFAIVDGDTGEPIPGCESIRSPSSINIAFLPTRNLRFRANVAPVPTGSVAFTTGDPPATPELVDSESPFWLPSGSNAVDAPWQPVPGSQTVKATAFALPGAQGVRGGSATASFDLRDDPSAW
ncbi:MAG: serine hydrolase [Geminicoccaceae bacterium]